MIHIAGLVVLDWAAAGAAAQKCADGIPLGILARGRYVWGFMEAVLEPMRLTDFFSAAMPAGWRVEGFCPAEESQGRRWAWGLGPRARISGPGRRGPTQLKLRLRAEPALVQVLWNGSPLRLQQDKARNALFFSGQVTTDSPWDLVFESRNWNGETTPWAAPDERPIAFLLEEMKLQPAPVGKVCPYPFSRMEMPGEPFVPCCQSWLKEEYFALEAGEDPWNGPAAQALRASVLDGSYRYCHLDRCGTTLLDTLDEEPWREMPDLPMSSDNLFALRSGDTIMPDGPSAATLMGDSRCNLACGSCRPEKLQRLDEAGSRRLARMREQLGKYASGLQVLKSAGDGEAFFSPDLREILADSGKWPGLARIDILTNGILFDETVLRELKPGADRISRVSVSVDAGNESTYQRVRGGDWRRLQRNLDWMAQQRRAGRFSHLGLSFVLRAENLDSLPDFFARAAELRVDEIYVSQLLPWDRMAIDFAAQAVHRPGHGRYEDYRAQWRELSGRQWPFSLRTNLP